MTSLPNFDLDKELADKLTVHKNIDQEIIITTVDKVRICIMETVDCLKEKRRWETPVALVSTFVATLVAAEFKDYGLKKEVWQAVFILGAVVSGVWLIKCAITAFSMWGRGTVDDIVGRIKASGTVQTPIKPDGASTDGAAAPRKAAR